MLEYEYDLVSKQIASQTAFWNELSSKTKVPLYSLPTEETTKQTVPYPNILSDISKLQQILFNYFTFTYYRKGQLLDSGNRSGET